MTSANAPLASKPRPIHIIDADTHLSEPHDLWVKRAPASLRDRVPQVKTIDGKIAWVIDGDKSIGDGAPAISAIYKDGSKAQGMAFATLSLPDVHLASWQVKARLEFMDEHDIWAQVVYP